MEASRWRARDIFLFFFGLFTVFVQRRGLDDDGSLRFSALGDLLEHGNLSSGKFSLVGPIFAAPLYWLGKAKHSPAWGCVSYNFLLYGIGLLALWQIFQKRLPRQTLFAFLLLTAFGSQFPKHVLGFYGEVFTAVSLGVGLALLATGKSRARRAGWFLSILGVVNTPASLIGFAAVSISESRRLRRWRILLLPLLAVSLIFAENWLRRGSPFHTGYDGPGEHGNPSVLPFSALPGFSYPLILGLLAILFSFGKGLFFFCPALFLPISLDDKIDIGIAQTLRLWWLFLVGLVLVYAKWWAWYGGWYWGPRFFLFASLPASLQLALVLTRYPRSRPALAALVWSFWVGVNGLVVGNAGLELCQQNNFAQEHLCWFVPEFSPLFRPFAGLHLWTASGVFTGVVFSVLLARTAFLLQKSR